MLSTVWIFTLGLKLDLKLHNLQPMFEKAKTIMRAIFCYPIFNFADTLVMLWIINTASRLRKRVILSNRIKTLSKCVIHSRFNETKLIQIEWGEIEILPTEIGSSKPQWNSFLAPPFMSNFWVRLMTHFHDLL